MSNTPKRTELLSTFTSAEKENISKEPSNSELEFMEDFEKTGLIIRGNEKTGYYITAGKWLIKKGYETPGDAKIDLQNRNWEIIMCLIDAMIQFDKIEPGTPQLTEISK